MIVDNTWSARSHGGLDVIVHVQFCLSHPEYYFFMAPIVSRKAKIKRPDNPTCQLFPITSQRNVKMGWER